MLLSITMKISTQKNDWLSIAGCLRQYQETYVLSHDLNALIRGGSGGIDSVLTAVLAAEVCNKLLLYGCSITIETNSEAERGRARKVGRFFVPISGKWISGCTCLMRKVQICIGMETFALCR